MSKAACSFRKADTPDLVEQQGQPVGYEIDVKNPNAVIAFGI